MTTFVTYTTEFIDGRNRDKMTMRIGCVTALGYFLQPCEFVYFFYGLDLKRFNFIISVQRLFFGQDLIPHQNILCWSTYFIFQFFLCLASQFQISYLLYEEHRLVSQYIDKCYPCLGSWEIKKLPPLACSLSFSTDMVHGENFNFRGNYTIIVTRLYYEKKKKLYSWKPVCTTLSSFIENNDENILKYISE